MVIKDVAWYFAEYSQKNTGHRKLREDLIARNPSVMPPRGARKDHMVFLAMQWDETHDPRVVPAVSPDWSQGYWNTPEGAHIHGPWKRSKKGKRKNKNRHTGEVQADDDDDDQLQDNSHVPDEHISGDLQQDNLDQFLQYQDTPTNPSPETLKTAIVAKWKEWLQANKTGRADLADPVEEELERLEIQAKGINGVEFTAWKFGKGGYGETDV